MKYASLNTPLMLAGLQDRAYRLLFIFSAYDRPVMNDHADIAQVSQIIQGIS
jgi:hypothetical protein